MSLPVDFLDLLAVADCAASRLADHRPCEALASLPAGARMFVRSNPVRALRLLWRHAGPQERATVAARVLVWLDKEPDRVRRVTERIQKSHFQPTKNAAGVFANEATTNT